MKMFLFNLLLLSMILSSDAVICNFTYAESLPNYPEKLINTIVNENKVYLKLSNRRPKSKTFTCDDGDEDFSRFISSKNHVLVASRFGSTAKEASHLNDSVEAFEALEPICDSIKSTIFPKTLPNILNKMVIVVNHGKLRQEVTIEKCSSSNQPCKFDINFPNNVITKCKQKYQTHTIKVLNEHDQNIIDESIYLPSGCECVFKYKSKFS